MCARTFHLLTSPPYVGQTIGIQPLAVIPEEDRTRPPHDSTRVHRPTVLAEDDGISALP